MALCVLEGTKGDFHLRTSEEAWFRPGKYCGNQHIKCYRQNSSYTLGVLFSATSSYSMCHYNNLGMGTQAGSQMGPCRAGNGHQSNPVVGFLIVAFVC